MQYFLYHKNTLYITTAGLIAAGKTRSNIDVAVAQKSKAIAACKITELGAGNYFLWDSMTNGWRACIETKFGNPYEYVSKEPIRKLVTKDFKAEAFYIAHQLQDGRKLAIEYIEKYTTAASWLNMLIYIEANKSIIKKTLNLSLATFFEHVSEIIATDNIDLPASYKRLRLKIIDYKAKGYEVLISSKFGNTQALKVNDDVSQSVLITMLSQANQYDYALIAIQYNKWAKENGYKSIEAQTVGIWHDKHRIEIDMTREGREAYNATNRRKVIRMRPSQPTYLWESDDNHLDWWFAGDKANEYRKIKGIIVTDSFNDLVVGYAITDGNLEGDGIVKMAYLCAAYYIKGLVNDGNWYLPYEIKTDQWNIAQLKPFYKNIAHYEETPVGSKNRGWLENFFGHIDWERGLKIGNNNYTGHNNTAKTRGVNMEATKANKKEWRHIKEAGEQMFEFVQRLRKMPRNYNPNNKSREDEWLDAWQNMPCDKKRPITDEQMLLKFGFKHTYENRITDQGISPTILGEQYKYAVPPSLYLENKGKKVNVIYDPFDMSRVLVTNNEGLRFIAYSITPVAGCMADMHEYGGRTLLNKILAEAKEDSKAIEAKQAQRSQILLDNNIDAETIFKLGASVPKAIKQWAEEKAFLPPTFDEPLEWIDAQPQEFNLNKELFNR